MRNTFKLSILLVFLSIHTGGFSQQAYSSPSSGDKEKVRAAVLDYVEGVYEADTTRIYRSVHPTLVKRGTFHNRQSGEYSAMMEMNFRQLVDLTRTWNKDGSRANSETIRDISIYDVQDKTASAKVVAAWGTDYFHLAKIDEKWYIMNVLWQSLKSN